MGRKESSIADELTLDKLYLRNGISSENIDRLIDYAKSDEAIKLFTSDSRRFYDHASYENWRQNENLNIYSLEDDEGDLAGIIWLGLLKLPDDERDYIHSIDPSDYPFTFGMRMYKHYRGSGIAVRFAKVCFSLFDKSLKTDSALDGHAPLTQNDTIGIWAECSNDNVPVMSMTKQLGFKPVTKPNLRGKILQLGKFSLSDLSQMCYYPLSLKEFRDANWNHAAIQLPSLTV